MDSNELIQIARDRHQLGNAPALDAETRKLVRELCRLIIDNAGLDSMITRAMAQKAEKISERLEAGESNAKLIAAAPEMALLIREAVNKGFFQGAMHRDAISILSRLTIFHGGEHDTSR